MSTCSGEPLIAIYDATGEYPQCSQGAKSYMTDCVYQSDFFSYIPSTRPVLGPDGVTCEGLNRSYTFVAHEKLFTGFDFYWVGGVDAWNE